jgi:MFS family permease
MVAYTLSYVDRQILSLLVKPIKADLGISDTQFSLLNGLAFAVLYALLGLPLGAWADVRNRRNLIAAGVGLWSVMTALCGFARGYAMLFAARVGVGIGEAALGPSAYSIIADSFPASTRSRALSVYSMGVYVGAGLAIMIGGLVIAAVSTHPQIDLPLVGEMRAWQASFLLVGAPGLLVSLWVLSVREPRRSAPASTAPVTTAIEAAASSRSSVRGVLDFMSGRRAFFLCHFGGVCLLTLLFNAVSAWIPAFLQRHYGFGPRDVAMSFGPILLAAGSLGILCGGWVADALRRRGYEDAELRSVMLGALGVWPFVVTATTVNSVAWSLTLFFPLFFFASFPFGAAIGALQLVTPPALRGRISALYLLFVNLTGIGLGGTATALVTDHVLHAESRVGEAMAWVAGVAAPLAALILWRGLKYYRHAARGRAS